MWQYEKKLQYPVNIKTPNPAMAKVIMSQFGGPDGELGAATRYLSQRYVAPLPAVKAILNDIGISWEEMPPPQNIITDKPTSGILIHTIHSNDVLSRYSINNQSGKDTAPKKKTSRIEKIIRIFV